MPAQNVKSNSGRMLILLGGCMLVAVALIGCQEHKPAAQSPSAEELLARMAEVYRTATSYADAGELHVVPADVSEDAPLPFAVSFERPQRVRIDALRASVVADGQTLRALVHALPGQIVVRPCPDKLHLADFSNDEMLDQAMRGQLGANLPQLTLLLEEDGLARLVGDQHPALLPDADHRGEKCHRVAISGPRGRSVFWISAQTHLLRKFEFPIDAIKDEFRLASIAAEFPGARVNESVSSLAFKMEIPAETKQLTHFLPPGPEPPEEPSTLLGKAADEFSLMDLNGSVVSRESLRDKVVVLDLWATWCGWCFEGFPALQKVYEKYRDNPQVVILAVNRDEASVSDARLKQAFEKSRLSIPIVRDAQLLTDKVFQVRGLPTTIILGSDGRVQDVHVGYDPQLSESLPKKLDQLLGGESIFEATLENYQREKEQYDEQQKRYDEQLAEAAVDHEAGPENNKTQESAERVREQVPR